MKIKIIKLNKVFTTTLILLFLLASCSKDPESLTISWDFTLDGQNYSFQEEIEDEFESGCATFQLGGQIILADDGTDAVSFQFGCPDITDEGTYTFDDNSNNALQGMIGMNGYTSDGGSVTVTISQFPTIIATDLDGSTLEETILEGDFSGSVVDVMMGNSHNISGSFRAVRFN